MPPDQRLDTTMSTEAGTAASAAQPAAAKEQAPKPQDKGKAPAAAAPAAEGERELTNAEKKKKAKEDKAAKRAQAKAAMNSQAGAAGASQAGGASGDKSGGAKPKQKQDLHPGAHHALHIRSGSRSSHPPPVIKEVKPAIPECFSHLSIARRISITHADKDVHPLVLRLGQQMSTFAIDDSTTRLEATLLAFKKVKLCNCS